MGMRCEGLHCAPLPQPLALAPCSLTGAQVHTTGNMSILHRCTSRHLVLSAMKSVEDAHKTCLRMCAEGPNRWPKRETAKGKPTIESGRAR